MITFDGKNNKKYSFQNATKYKCCANINIITLYHFAAILGICSGYLLYEIDKAY